MKNISFGNWVTIIIVSANIVFTVGIMSKNVLNAQESANTALSMAHTNEKNIAVIMATMEQGFDNLESLIKNGN